MRSAVLPLFRSSEEVLGSCPPLTAVSMVHGLPFLASYSSERTPDTCNSRSCVLGLGSVCRPGLQGEAAARGRSDKSRALQGKVAGPTLGGGPGWTAAANAGSAQTTAGSRVAGECNQATQRWGQQAWQSRPKQDTARQGCKSGAGPSTGLGCSKAGNCKAGLQVRRWVKDWVGLQLPAQVLHTQLGPGLCRSHAVSGALPLASSECPRSFLECSAGEKP